MQRKPNETSKNENNNNDSPGIVTLGDGRGKVACPESRAGARAGLGHICLKCQVLMCHAQSQGVEVLCVSWVGSGFIVHVIFVQRSIHSVEKGKPGPI